MSRTGESSWTDVPSKKTQNPGLELRVFGRPLGGTVTRSVVETNGFSEPTWLDWDGHPHSEHLRTTPSDTASRDVGHMAVQLTLDDNPAASLEAVDGHDPAGTGGTDTEMLASVCQENEKDRSKIDSPGPELRTTAVPVSTLTKYAGVYDYVDLAGRSLLVTITVSTGALYLGSGRHRPAEAAAVL